MRYDKLMQFGWKFLFPVALGNTLVAAAFRGYFPKETPWILGAISLVALVLVFAVTSRKKERSVARAAAGD
jgi:hypothetical protein